MENEYERFTMERTARPWLHGFWKEEHNRGSKPVLIKGDNDSFKADISLTVDRQRNRIEALSNCRWMVIEEWESWWFEVIAGEWNES